MDALTIEQPTVISYVPPSSLSEHPEAWRIPEMSPEEWADFNESVRVRGAVTDPVFALPDGRVFDGRHRLRSAKENELSALPVITWDITEDEALQRMSEAAVLRRSLKPGQRAAILLEFTEVVAKLREEARERQRMAAVATNATLGRETVNPDLGQASPLRGDSSPVAPDLGHREYTGGRGATAKALAEKASIGKSSMEYLIAVQREEPELFDRVKAGEITINKAYAETKRRKQPVDKPKPAPKRQPMLPKSPTQEKLGNIERDIEALGTLSAIPGESPFSPNNLVRYHLSNDVVAFARGMCVSFEAFCDGVDSETTEQYITRIKRIMHGCSLIVSAFDSDAAVRALYEQLAYLVEGTCSEEGIAAITKTITEGRN